MLRNNIRKSRARRRSKSPTHVRRHKNTLVKKTSIKKGDPETDANLAADTTEPDTNDTFTLWTSEDCSEPLPVATIYEEQNFGQFIALVDEGGASIQLDDVRKTAGKLTTREPTTLSDLAGRRHASELSSKDDHRYTVRNLNQLLATKRLPVGGKAVPVDLDARAIERMLAGEEADVRIESQQARLQPLPGASHGPAVTEFRVESVPEFLARPVVPGRGGKPYPVSLDAKQVERLRGGESIQLETASRVPLLLHAPQNFLSGGPQGKPELGRTFTTPPYRLPPPLPRPLIGVYLPWRQRWILDGYARGRLLYSLCLAPQEDTTVELFTWDRIRSSLDQTSETDVEQSTELADTTKDVTDVMRELTRSSDFQVNADARVSATYTSVTAAVSAGLNIGQKTNDVAKTTTNTLHESTLKAVSRVKVHRTSKIAETREVGSENRVTRKVRNQNLCHTLTFDYFEVVSGYIITTEFLRDQAVLVALFPNPLPKITFSLEEIRLYERSLRMALTDPNLAAGFDAARLIASREQALVAVCAKPACAPPPSPGGSTDKQNQEVTPDPLVEAVRKEMKRITTAWEALKSADWNGFFLDLDGKPDGTNPTPEHLEGIRRWFCTTMLDLYQHSVSSALDDLQSAALDGDSNALASAGSAFRAAIGEQGLAAIIAQLKGQNTQIENLRLGLIPKYSFGAENYWWDSKLKDLGCYDLDDAGLSNAWRAFDEAWKLWAAAGPMGGQPSGNQAGKEDQAVDQIAFAYPLRELADAMERFETLQKHLQDAESYYRYAIFIGLPVAEQLERLQLSATPGLVQPTVVGMVGKYVALTINTAAMPGLKKWFDDKMHDEALPTDGLKLSRRVTLPTGGVSVTTRLGKCTGCEKVLERNRELDISLKEQQLRVQTLEGDRRQRRLALPTPNLDPPDPPANTWAVTLKATAE